LGWHALLLWLHRHRGQARLRPRPRSPGRLPRRASPQVPTSRMSALLDLRE